MQSIGELDGFKWSPQVEELAKETFTQVELSGGFTELSNSLIVEAVSRLGLFLVSDPTPPGRTRQFHYYDGHLLAVFAALSKTEPFSSRRNRRDLAQQLAHLLFGDVVTPQEAAERKAETARDYERAARTPSGRAKFAGRMLKTHFARREEIRADPRNASPFWWNRSADVNFFVFACHGGKLVTLCADRSKTPTLDMHWLESIGARSWMNATKLFCMIDGQLAHIVADRVEAE